MRLNMSDDEYCGTTKAAKLLGVSVGTVQNLVDTNELISWRTSGGHRRIELASLKQLMRRRHSKYANARLEAALALRVVTTDEMLEEQIRAHSPVQKQLDKVSFHNSLVSLSLMHTDSHEQIVLIDAGGLKQLGGVATLREVRKHRTFSSSPFLLLCDEAEGDSLELNAFALAYQMSLVPKPLDMRWLDGYVQAMGFAKNESQSG